MVGVLVEFYGFVDYFIYEENWCFVVFVLELWMLVYSGCGVVINE